MYKPKYFQAYELVPKKLYEEYESKSYRLLWQFNPLVLETADMLRERFGKVTVNDWYYGGSFQERGLRLDGTDTGSSLSAHKRGAALDMAFHDITAPEIRKIMKDLGCFEPGFRLKEEYTDEEKPFRYIHRIENTLNGEQISWFHFDIFNTFHEDGSIISLDI